MVLGFGETERATAFKIIDECVAALSDRGQDGLKEVQTYYADLGNRYRAMSRVEAPERYTYFWASYCEVYPGRYFVDFTMHHINRRHAFAPDGWAMLATRWVLLVDPDDGASIFCETERT